MIGDWLRYSTAFFNEEMMRLGGTPEDHARADEYMKNWLEREERVAKFEKNIIIYGTPCAIVVIIGLGIILI